MTLAYTARPSWGESSKEWKEDNIGDVVRCNIKRMIAKYVMVIADTEFPLAVSRGTTRGEHDWFFEKIDSYASRKMIASGALTPAPGDDGLSDHSAFAGRLLDILEEN